MFQNDREEYHFKWETMGRVKAERPDVGTDVPVIVFRLYAYTLRDSIIKHLDVHKANHILKEAGFNAGVEFYNNVIAVSESTGNFFTDFELHFKGWKLGLLVFDEDVNKDSTEYSVKIYQDLNSSGVEHVSETICEWDEGFIAGVLTTYSKANFYVLETECWASGHEFCRFKIKRLG